ncbi:hypothetical protein [Paenibacillus soyae]|uniref:Uncharacterized protein n=1 Tax=Paenibacillus soyae TaxID=2969249 RepID=A0A9X2N1T1_9BACL|nr:hypothetical protein [Paenibacillus soyae]MCR2807477.1 hypothetical protein [Paenibacillus soyae]
MLWHQNKKRQQIKEGVWAIVFLWGAIAVIVAKLLHLPMSPPTDWVAAITAPLYKPIVAWIKGG